MTTRKLEIEAAWARHTLWKPGCPWGKEDGDGKQG